jgi:hypothetical protein
MTLARMNSPRPNWGGRGPKCLALAILAALVSLALGGVGYAGYLAGKRSESIASSAALSNSVCFWCLDALTCSATEDASLRRDLETFFERAMYDNALPLAAYVRDHPSCDQSWANILPSVRRYISQHPEPKPIRGIPAVDLPELDSVLAAAIESWRKANPQSDLAQLPPR